MIRLFTFRGTTRGVVKLMQFSMLFICLASMFAHQSSAPAASKGTKDGWELVQRTEEGDFHIWATRDAIRVYSDLHKYSIIAMAPNWDVYAIDTDKRIYAKVPWRRFETQGLFDFFQRIPLPTNKERVLEKMNFKGVPATLIRGKYPQNDPTIKAEAVTNRYMLGQSRQRAPLLESFLYIVTDQLDTSRYVNTVVRILYGLPAIEEFPLTYAHRKKDGKQTYLLSTKSISKAKVSGNVFSIDLTCKRVNRPLDVVYKARSQDVNEIFDSLGVGTGFGSTAPVKK